MTYTSTFRASVRAALATQLEAFRASLSDSTLLRQTYKTRPATLNPPAGFVGHWRESTINLDASIATRQPTVELVFAQGIYSNNETVDRLDALMDAAVSYWGDSAQAHIANGVIMGLSTEDADITIPAAGPNGADLILMGGVLLLSLNIQEGGL